MRPKNISVIKICVLDILIPSKLNVTDFSIAAPKNKSEGITKGGCA